MWGGYWPTSQNSCSQNSLLQINNEYVALFFFFFIKTIPSFSLCHTLTIAKIFPNSSLLKNNRRDLCLLFLCPPYLCHNLFFDNVEIKIYVVTDIGSITTQLRTGQRGGGGLYVVPPTKCIKTKQEETDCTQFLMRRIFPISHPSRVGVKHVESAALASTHASPLTAVSFEYTEADYAWCVIAIFVSRMQNPMVQTPAVWCAVSSLQ